jgi:hypothetical protein
MDPQQLGFSDPGTPGTPESKEIKVFDSFEEQKIL